MSLPRSEEKRIALLEAASAIVAAQGLGATTASIARGAGVAEGTLFRYFPTKDELINELYTYIKLNLAEALRKQLELGAAGSLEDSVRALWDGYIDWGVSNPAAIKALSQLAVSDKVTAETRAKVTEMLPDIQCISRACIAKGGLASLPGAFADSVFMALADTTIQFAAREPEHSTAYKAAGFKVLWEGLTR